MISGEPWFLSELSTVSNVNMVDMELLDLTQGGTAVDQMNPAEVLLLSQLDPMDRPRMLVFLLNLLHHKEVLKDLLDHPENATVKPSTTVLLDLLERREFPDTTAWMDILDWTVLMVLMLKMPKLRLNNTKGASLVLKDLPDLLDNLEDPDLEE